MFSTIETLERELGEARGEAEGAAGGEHEGWAGSVAQHLGLAARGVRRKERNLDQHTV